MHKVLHKLLLLMGIALFVFEVSAYNINKGVKWLQAETTMHVNLPGADGLWNNSFLDALRRWNDATVFKFHVVNEYRNPCNGSDKLNGVDWQDTDCGDELDQALAVTHITWNARTLKLIQADIVFNSNEKWNVYQGNLQRAEGGGWLNDFHRVALHELGHVIGLDHVAQPTNSIMVPTISNLDEIMADDINGVTALYGVSDTNQAPVAAFTVSPLNGTAPLTVTLDASASTDPDGTVSSYAWSSSNGYSATGKVSGLTFYQAGIHTINLTVTDDKGLTSGTTGTVTVTASPALTAKPSATYDASSGILILNDVLAFGRHYYVELKIQSDNAFRIADAHLLLRDDSDNPALYDDVLWKLIIPIALINGDDQAYYAELTNKGDYHFALQKLSRIE